MKTAIRLRCAPLLAGLLVALSGCANRLNQQQRLWLSRGQEAYEQKDYSRAIDQLSRFLNQVHDKPEVAQALYVRGMSRAQLGQREQAYADLRRCAATPSQTETSWRAYVVLGTLHFEDRQWERAAQNFEAALQRMPEQPPKDAVLYRLGLCHERMGRWRAAQSAFREITRVFNTGSYADAAYRRVRLKADHYAVQCGAFREKSNAEAFRDSLAQKGLEAHILQEVRSRTPLYVVLVGKYGAYDEALSQLAMVREHFVPDAILWP
jgi:tetratricopeptide (TPR) repeat protein